MIASVLVTNICLYKQILCRMIQRNFSLLSTFQKIENTPFDLFFVGFYEFQVYKSKSRSIHDLRENILDFIANFPHNVC